MKHRFFGIFSKVFLYTMLILVLVIGGIFIFFSSQVESAVTVTQQRQMAVAFQPLLSQLHGKSNDEIVTFAKEFHEKNRSFDFCFETEDGQILFQTENFTLPPDMGEPDGDMNFRRSLLGNRPFNLSISKSGKERFVFLTMTANGVKLYVSRPISDGSVVSELMGRAAWIFGLVFLISLLAAAVFARRIAKPIQQIVGDTKKMSRLEKVSPPGERRDEIGQLAGDVYAMYERLKSTIRQLEDEIRRKKEMEENQRYFFSAASHELKTPIAAAAAILEGMMENVIKPEEHPRYLRECRKLMNEQNKLVTEILDIVKLNEEMTKQREERLRLRDCVNNVLTAHMPIMEAKEQRLSVEIDGRIFCVLDPGLFGKALSNVVLNAAQNSPIGAEIRIYAQEKKDRVRLCVWNSDVQIPAELLPRLFEPFVHTDEARTRKEGRSGLGLTIVRKALDLMGVPFSLENCEGGALFQMELPGE